MMSGRDLAGIAEVFMGAFMLEYQDVIYGGWDWLLHMGVDCEVKVRAQIFFGHKLDFKDWVQKEPHNFLLFLCPDLLPPPPSPLYC